MYVPARGIFLEDVVLDRSSERRRVNALALGRELVEEQEHRSGSVDRHRRRDLVLGDAAHQQLHVVERVRSPRRPCRPLRARPGRHCRSPSGSGGRRPRRARSARPAAGNGIARWSVRRFRSRRTDASSRAAIGSPRRGSLSCTGTRRGRWRVWLFDVEGVERKPGLRLDAAGIDRSCVRPGGLLVRLAELGEHAGSRRRVEECHEPACGALARARVEQLQTELGEVIEARLDVVDRHRRRGGARCPASPGSPRSSSPARCCRAARCASSPTSNMTASMPSEATDLAVRRGRPGETLVRGDRDIEVGDRNSHVVDPGECARHRRPSIGSNTATPRSLAANSTASVQTP